MMHLQKVMAAVRAASGVAQWQITEVASTRHERYLTFGQIESERRATAVRWQVWLALDPRDGTHGEATFAIGQGDDDDALVDRVRTCLESAAAALNPVWQLPAPGEPATAEPPTDPALGCDASLLTDPTLALDAATAELSAAVPSDVRLCALELFATINDRRLVNHRGLDLRSRSTRWYLEWVLLHRPTTPVSQATAGEAEFIDTLECAVASEAGLTRRMARCVDAVRGAAIAGPPPSGAVPVVLTDADVESLIDYALHHADAATHVRTLNAVPLGGSFAPSDAEVGGTPTEPFDLSVDPAIPSLAAYGFDSHGYRPQATALVRNFRLIGLTGAGRWQQRLSRTPTGEPGTRSVPAGPTPLDTLCRGALEIVRFSVLSVRADTGAFGGEIRFAWWHHPDGTRIPVKGGSVTGTIATALPTARWSRELGTTPHGRLPLGVRLEGVQVVG